MKKRFISIVTVLTMLATMLTATAAPPEPTLTADPQTYTRWNTEAFTAESTRNAGVVWTDKSVIQGNTNPWGVAAQDEGKFLVGLSAIGSAISTMSSATTVTNTDTVLVLDISNSMSGHREDLAYAVNEAIAGLMNINENNRISVVLYNASAYELLPMGRYRNNSTANTYVQWNRWAGSYSNVADLEKWDTTSNSWVSYTNSVDAESGTNHQAGILKALDTFNEVTDTNDRVPVVVLMTDGASTYAYNGFTDGTGEELGQGSYSNSVGLTFATQLSAAYARKEIEIKYNTPLHFYTLGFGNNTNEELVELVLDPENYRDANDGTAQTIKHYWKEYEALANNDTLTVSVANNNTADIVKSYALAAEDMYYVDRNFHADSNELVSVFENIVAEIKKIETATHPVLVDQVLGNDFSGYVHTVDKIGKYMEFDGLRGMMLAGTLYTGQDFASKFETEASALEFLGADAGSATPEGDAFVISIKTRLGLEENGTSREDANAAAYALITGAFESGQIHYSSGGSDFSNYFGWYADEDGDCLGWWNDRLDPDGTNFVPTTGLVYPGTGTAKYVNKSYLFLGASGDSNAMYLSVRVQKEIATGVETVALAIPASLLPIIQYDVEIENTETAPTIRLESNIDSKSPITLLYEVKLADGINSDTLPLLDSEYLAENSDGSNVYFYTNQWENLLVSPHTPISDAGVNTYTYFTPNTENPVFYFKEDTPIYVENGTDYIPYTDSTKPTEAGTYYRRVVYYEDNGGTVTEEIEWRKITSDTLSASATWSEENGYWYIPEGTLHRHLSAYKADKKDSMGNSTNYSETLTERLIPFLTERNNGVYTSSILGNNGRIAIPKSTSVGGISITKNLAEGSVNEASVATDFTFELTATGVTDGNYKSYIRNGESGMPTAAADVVFSSSTANVTLKHGQTLYIAGLPVGATISVSENPISGYTLDSTVGDTNITIAENTYPNVTFINEIDNTGYTSKWYKVEYYYDGVIDPEQSIVVDGQTTGDAINYNTYAAAQKDYNSTKYALDYVTFDSDGDGVNAPTTVTTDQTVPDNNGAVLKVYYGIDKLDEDGPSIIDGDGTPDRYQAVVTYRIENGRWSDNSTADKHAVFTVATSDGNGGIQNVDPYPTLNTTIPEGMTPFDGYGNGHWRDTAPTSDTAVVDGKVYIYTYTRQINVTVNYLELDTHTILQTPYTAKIETNSAYDVSAQIPNSISYNSKTYNKNSVIGDITATSGTQDIIVNVFYKAQPSGGGGRTNTSYTLTYESNGGTEFEKEKHPYGKVVELDKVPEKDGYIFDGWHLDKACEDDATEVKMTKNITVYANWIEDNGTAGNGHKTPSSLNGDDHFAYIIGYPDDTVRPNASITRAEVTTIFFRLLKDEIRDTNLAETNVFDDITADMWYNAAISTMAKLGIVEGRLDNEFVADAYITRAEFATICARFDDSEFTITDEFTDIAGHWAEDYIHEAAAHGWIKGYDDNTFKPDQYITRAEAMTMVNRVLNRIPENADSLLDDMIKWPDNSDVNAWYYLAVQEATNSHDYDKINNIYEKWTKLREVTDWQMYEE